MFVLVGCKQNLTEKSLGPLLYSIPRSFTLQSTEPHSMFETMDRKSHSIYSLRCCYTLILLVRIRSMQIRYKFIKIQCPIFIILNELISLGRRYFGYWVYTQVYLYLSPIPLNVAGIVSC